MRRLHVQFYLAILATLAIFVVASAIFWGATARSRDDTWGANTVAEFAQGLLPPASAPLTEQQRALDQLHQRLKIDLALYDSEGRVLAAAGNIPRLPRRGVSTSGWAMVHGGPLWVLPLDDGRRLVVRHPHPPAHIGWRVFVIPLLIVLAFALGAYPIARRLTRRLQRLQAGVEQLGEGDLTTRVAVEGRDEVAALARSFNQSAQRVEELVKSHKLLLANCSHELRTPLARVRLGIERLAGNSDSSVRDELTRSIAELDALIEEMLLASRLDALRTLERSEEVDLLALVAEEAAYFDVAVEGQPTVVHGDPALLRRMVRNLLDNARQHGGGATRVEVSVTASGTKQIIVEDQGEGIAQADQERIFEPFYRAGGARQAGRGFGLGLAIVRRIARAHAGDVSYVSLDGAGSRFNVFLP
jgi:signal transduction histidine kinase